jgi:hypothetical protein
MRPRLGSEDAPKLEVEGFAAETVPYEGFNSGVEGWEEEYASKMAAASLFFPSLLLKDD